MWFRSSAWQRLTIFCAGLVLYLTQAGGQQAQTTAEITTKDAPITFSTAVDLVLVPVVVRDAQGHAVGNLTKDDFQLFDKGKPQVITKFSIDKAETPPILPDTSLETDADGNPRPKPPGTAVAEPLASHFIAWVFDDVHLSFGDLAQTRVAAKRVLKESFEPGTRAAIYTTSGHTQLDFTEDRDKLDATLDQLRPWPTTPDAVVSRPCPDISYFQADAIVNKNDPQALLAAQTEYLACTPKLQPANTSSAPLPPSIQAQKDAAARASTQAEVDSVVRGTSVSALAVGSQDTRNTLLALKALVRRMAAMPGSRGIVMVSPGFFLTIDHRLDEMELMNLAIRGNVVISSLDARGLFTLIPGGGAETQGGPSQVANILKLQMEQQEATANEDILGELAEATGGQFFHNSNDFFGGLKLVATQPEYIYVLGFAPVGLKYNGSYHTLKVTLKNGAKMQLEARRGYFERQHMQNAEEQAQEELKDAFFSRDEIRNIPVDLHTQFFKTGDYNARLSIMARVDIRHLRYKKTDGRNDDTLTVVGGVFDKDGKYIIGSQKTISLKLKDETLGTVPEGGITVKSNLDVASGSYVVRLVVRDSEGEVMSALNSALEIP
jgi:VWFA-related protein